MPRQRHRVAVVVFCETEGVDYHDAGTGAVMAIEHALNGGETGATGHAALARVASGDDNPPRVGFIRKDGLRVMADVHDVMEIGMAAGNGYLWTHPTRKAFPREGGLTPDSQ
jgi:hypothetical protein